MNRNDEMFQKLPDHGRRKRMNSHDNSDSSDEWQLRYETAVFQFSNALKDLHQNNPWPELPILPKALSYLMTELWDNGFSQTEIRSAYEEAIAELPGYAAGEESRF
jgi:hypothetical protein